MNKLKTWLATATVPERNKLVRLAGTTLGALRQAAGGYRNKGKVSTTPDFARRIEQAAVKVHREGLPEIKRADLCIACSKCEYAKGR